MSRLSIGFLFTMITCLPSLAFAGNPCDPKAATMALQAFHDKTGSEGKVTYLYSQWGFLSDIPIYTIAVTVSSRDRTPAVEISYDARLEANEACYVWSFGEHHPGN